MNDAAGAGISTFVVQPDPTRTWNDGFSHQSLRGFARKGVSAMVEVRVDFSDEWCGGASMSGPSPWCAQIQFKQNGAWVSLVGGNLNFSPDVAVDNTNSQILDFKPSMLSSTIMSAGVPAGPLELWGGYNTQGSNNCGPCPGPTGGGFRFYQLNPDWSLGNSYRVSSLIRCMPSGRAVLRAAPAPVYLGSSLYVLSPTNEDNVCYDINNGFDPQLGMYIVWTQLQ